MTDDEFLRRFEAADLDTFGHADHVRAAWAYLERDGFERALPAMIDGIKRFAAAKGSPGKFHYTMTCAWLHLVADAIRRHPSARTATALLAECPLLADPRAIDVFYNAETLRNEQARATWIEPDRAPLRASHDAVPVQ